MEGEGRAIAPQVARWCVAADLPGVQTLVEEWLVHLEGNGSKLNTRKNYRAALKTYFEFLASIAESWEPVTPKALDAWKVHLISIKGCGFSVGVARSHLSAVRNFYRWARWCGHVAQNLLPDVRMGRTPKLLPKPYSEAEIGRMIEGAKAVGLMELAMIEVLYSTGCRISELRGMNLSDVDPERGTILTMGKGAQERYLEVGRPALQALKMHLASLKDLWGFAPEGPIWRGKLGRRIHLKDIRARLRSIGRAAEVAGRIIPHRFRHSMATHLLDHGASLETVKELLGHANIQTTMIYTEVSRERVRKSFRECHPRA